MPLTALLRGLAGALAALLATWIVLFCFAETRMQFGVPTWGVAWMTFRGRVPHFDPLWQPWIHYGVFNAAFGFVLALRLTSLRTMYFVLAGIFVFFIGGWWLNDGDLGRRYGQAGVNCGRLLHLFFVIIGGTAGALAAERGGWWLPKKRKPKPDVELPLCRSTPTPPEELNPAFNLAKEKGPGTP